MGWEPVIAYLTERVRKEGTVCLTRDAEEIRTKAEELLSGEAQARRMATALYVSLLMEIPEAVRHEGTADVLELLLQECVMEGAMAASLAEMYARLFTKELLEELSKREAAGLQELFECRWECTWEGETAWYPRGTCVHMDLSYSAQYTFIIEDEAKVQKELAGALEANPFLDGGDLAEILQDRLDTILDREFEDYGEEDDYYPPTVEDFGAEEYLQEACGKMGLALIAFDGEGRLSDYEPN